jgi:hypothetical protein
LSELPLHCFNSITVHPPELGDDWVRATIEVDPVGRPEGEAELRYKYQEDLPARGSKEFEDLEYLMGLTVLCPLVNYSLFTKEIRLKYPLDPRDRHLFEDFLAIQSRETLVNRVLRGNEYLLDEAKLKDNPDIAKLYKDYRAELKPSGTVRHDFARRSDPDRVCVLSSGGKESLLSYGLLKEIGAEVYPFYFNESGGHWLTAKPAFDAFTKFEPRTRKVWSNVDRVYLFIKDHMRAIRPDFREVHADLYPIRTFTFLHYAFAFWPYVLTHDISAFVVGNEYDEPGDWTYLGVPHHYGIYDQTQEFDSKMTAFYRERGLGCEHFSVVRPLSSFSEELIIARRYPKLLPIQRSCHATHLEDGKVTPCGRCTKCLGVLAILVASEVDPRVMGYRDEDLHLLERRLQETRLRLDRHELEHTLFRLSQKGYKVLKGDLKYEGGYEPQEHPEVESMKFDPLNSLVENVPARFRAQTFKILGEHTRGALRLEGGTWHPFAFKA